MSFRIVQTVNACVGVKENNNSLSSINIFPNPSNGVFSIELVNTNEIATMEIYNVLGAKIKSQKI